MKKIDKEKIKTWLVTGASSGIGHELTKQLLERGYNVVAISRRGGGQILNSVSLTQMHFVFPLMLPTQNKLKRQLKKG